jgi:hypothetical protein
MPELGFQITAVEPASRGLTPLLYFKLRITVSPGDQFIQGVILNAQIQIQSPQRPYSESEKERLFELFGAPEQWGRSLRNRLWTHSNATVGAFTGETLVVLPVPCSFDLNVAATKYFYALESGEIPLLFLFTGSIFYANPAGSFQMEPIPWSKECVYRMPVKTWRELMDQHYPNCAWLYLRRDVFDRLASFKRQNGLATWDQAVLELLPVENGTPEQTQESPAVLVRTAPEEVSV